MPVCRQAGRLLGENTGMSDRSRAAVMPTDFCGIALGRVLFGAVMRSGQDVDAPALAPASRRDCQQMAFEAACRRELMGDVE
jgi:hypothetical protein